MLDQPDRAQGPRSPIKPGMLRQAGQSLDEELQRFEDEEYGSLAAVIMFALILAVLEWCRWAFNMKPHPVILTISAAGAICVCLLQVRRVRRRAHALRQGRDGERQVGQVLDDLRADGCIVLHDVPADGFNLDHVIVSRYGVFCIETKAITKPNAKAEITYDGERLVVPGWRHADEALVQAVAEAGWLRKLLADMSGRPVEVQPVLVFPSWYVRCPKAPWQCRTWVLEPKALLKPVPGGQEKLTPERVSELAHHLRQHVKNRKPAAA